ncbi:MAG: hypothetical protein WC934_04010 [Acidithiobacillus sp.]|jgi:hypothetical protein|uniref:hypothetical protein n=1 Tax=Acidithiobacillus sp. TaxID=1872118 RepID=UPI00355F5187
MPLPKKKISDIIERANSLVRFGVSNFDGLRDLICEVEHLPASSGEDAREKYELLCALSSFYGDLDNTQKYISKIALYPYSAKAQATRMLSLMRLGLFQPAGEVCSSLSDNVDLEIVDDATHVALYTGHLQLFLHLFHRLEKMQKVETLQKQFIAATKIYDFLSHQETNEETLVGFISTSAEVVGRNCRYIGQTALRYVTNSLGLSYIFYVVEPTISMFQLDLLITKALLDRYGDIFADVITFSVERFNPNGESNPDQATLNKSPEMA